MYESVKQGRLQFRYFDLLEPLPQLLTRMKEYQPDIWIAPPSMLRLLAEAQQSGDMNLHPRRIIAVAEVLDPLDRQQIEQTFRQKVHQAYQCTEGFLGATCSHGTLHLNEDIVHIEKKKCWMKKITPVRAHRDRFLQKCAAHRPLPAE
ncbi:hypothetical protein ACFSQ7_31160 [Paenibacillus rhizoplanae]